MFPTRFIARLGSRFVYLALCATVFTTSARAAETPLYREIDSLIARRLDDLKIAPATRSDDAEFVRRIYLDLTGVVPTARQAREFLDDRTPDKRRRLLDALLASPDYALHMAREFDVMLIERRIPTITSYDVTTAAWRAYLTEAFAANKPWDAMVREILASDGAGTERSAAVKFYLVRDVAPHSLTRDVGRLFLGVDLQCAQCHDDPRFADYLQADYYGIYAFVDRMKVHPLMPRGAQVAETAEGKTTFTSVFTAMRGETNPRLPGGGMLADPATEKGKEYVVKPGPKERGIPVYSRRLKLSEHLPRNETKGFARNIANRLWAQFFGRGLVHPLDMHHAANPPSHPELLDRLERWMVEHRYDLRGFIRELMLTDTYQRSSILPSGARSPPAEAFAVAPLRGLTAEQLRWSWLQATGRIDLHHARFEAAAKKPATSKNDAVKSNATKTDVPKGAPATTVPSPGPVPSTGPEPAWKTRLAANEALERLSATLLTAFAGLPGQAEAGFHPVVDQALYLRNSEKLLPLLVDEPGTTPARLAAMSESGPLAEELYLSVLARRPTADEAGEVSRLLETTKTAAERREALQSLLWGLLLSAEFRLNH
jgi:hypothetical protein